jgi:hypothetical protein
MTKNEIWKDIKGYEGIYQISTLGKIKSLLRNNLILKHSLMHGYPSVFLFKNGVSKGYRVHRLLAIAFIENKKNYPIVRHLNDIRNDFRIENLSWGTQSDNGKDCFKNGYIISEKQKKSIIKANSKLVLDIKYNIYYNSIKEVSEKFDIKYSTLSNKLNGNRRNNTQFILK